MSSKTGASEIGAILEAQKSPAEFSNYAQDVFMKNKSVEAPKGKALQKVTCSGLRPIRALFSNPVPPPP